MRARAGAVPFAAPPLVRKAMRSMRSQRGPVCPTWCTVQHGDLLGEDDLVHSSADVVVRQLRLRLCQSTLDGRQDGPYVLVGDHELTGHEAEGLVAALGRLVHLAAQDHAGGLDQG